MAELAPDAEPACAAGARKIMVEQRLCCLQRGVLDFAEQLMT